MSGFTYCLNTSTIRPAGLLDKIRIASQAGYSAIELWVADVEEHVAQGGHLSDVARALDDCGLSRPSMISLKEWCVADDSAFQAALETCRRRLDMARQLGVERIVAGPPREAASPELLRDRYQRLLAISVEHGVPASLEFLGFARSVSTLESAWQIAEASGLPERSVTADAWHMFRGGTHPAALELVPADGISIFHWNDAPAQPPREEQTDSHRVMPGDGILDLAGLAAQLRNKGWHGALSLELFNEEYWRHDPLSVAREGLAKMMASVVCTA